MAGRTIRIFLVEGTPGGLRTAEIGLSTCKAVMARRSALDVIGKRHEATQTAVYFLIGEDLEVPGRTAIYIGEADVLYDRIVQHNKDPDKSFWNQVVFFTTSDQRLTKGHAQHLEALLISEAVATKQYTVTNRTTPHPPHLPESDTAEMQEFLDHIKLLSSALGIRAFEAANATPAPGQAETPRFTTTGSGFKAISIIDPEGRFIVEKGSVARKEEAPTLSKSCKSTRAELLHSGVLKESDEGYVFTQDYAFDSAIQSAGVTSGSTVNGREYWHHAKDGMTYATWKDARVDARKEALDKETAE